MLERAIFRTLLITLPALIITACGEVDERSGRPPQANAGADQTVSVGETVTLDGTASSHPDGKQLSYSWAFEVRPQGSEATIDKAHQAEAEFVADVAGDYGAVLTVSDGTTSAQDSVTVQALNGTPDEQGVLLEGDHDAPALQATYDLHVPLSYPSDAFEVDPESPVETAVLRSEVEIAFALDATIGEVNDVLESIEAKIVSMLGGPPILVVKIPDPGSLEALVELTNELEQLDVVEFVSTSRLVDDPIVHEQEPLDPQLVPDHLDPDIQAQMRRIDHHLSVRAHAAWNAREAIQGSNERPWLIIQDAFGDGVPEDGFAGTFTAGDYGAGGGTSRHGYHVLGIILGAFEPDASVLDPDRRAVTGMFPDGLRVRAVDRLTEDANTWPRRMNQVVHHMNSVLDDDAAARFVVNSSQNSRGYSDQEPLASSWTAKIRLVGVTGIMDGINRLQTPGSGLEDRYVHFTSAGNTRTDDDGNVISWEAVDNSVYSYAALGTDMSYYGVAMPPLNNTFVVENRVRTRHTAGGAERPQAGCASSGSIMHGTISAIGTSVYSFGRCTEWSGGSCDVSDGQEASAIGGTSMATPQAAGLAAYLWSLDPGLSVTELVSVLTETAVDDQETSLSPGTTCNDIAPQPVIDAYAAVLAAGGDAARTALVDVTGSGQFDASDIEAFLDAFAARGQVLDYGRYELTGDGRPGALTRSERVDLSGDGSYGTVSQTIRTAAGTPTSISYNEAAVNDFDVLCYYAYSPIYQGDTGARNQLIGNLCAGLEPLLTITQPSYGADVSGAAPVELSAALSSLPPAGDAVATDLYKIFWWYDLEDGTTIDLGVTEHEEALSASIACSDAAVTAEARHVNVPRTTRDSVSFTVTNPAAQAWQPTILQPAAASPYFDVGFPENTFTLEGQAQRITCSEIVATTDNLSWRDENSSQLGTGSALTLDTDFFSSNGGYDSRTVTLHHSATGARDERTIIPCSSLFTSGTRKCPDPAFQNALQQYLADLYQDFLDAQAAEDAIRAELIDLFDDGVPEPFPFPPDDVLSGILETLPTGLDRIAWDLFNELLNLTSGFETDFATFQDHLLELEIDATETLDPMTDADDLLDLFLNATSMARATHDFYALSEQGGSDGWDHFLFADDAAIEQASGLAPVHGAVTGFMTGFLETNPDDADGIGAFNQEVSMQAGVYGSILGAIEELDPEHVP